MFITRDPAGFVDGPNLYTYVRQNPWTKFDPLGLDGGVDPSIPLDVQIAQAMKHFGMSDTEAATKAKAIAEAAQAMNPELPGSTTASERSYAGLKMQYEKGEISEDQFTQELLSNADLMAEAESDLMNNAISNAIVMGLVAVPGAVGKLKGRLPSSKTKPGGPTASDTVKKNAAEVRAALEKEKAALEKGLKQDHIQLEKGRNDAARLRREGREPNPEGLGKEIEKTIPERIRVKQERLNEIGDELSNLEDGS